MCKPQCTTFEALLVKKAGPFLLPVILASSPGPGPLAVHGLGEAIALAGKDHNVGIVDQPADEGRGQAVVAENGVPLAELQVGSAQGEDRGDCEEQHYERGCHY